MSTKNNPSKISDCYAKADPDEPMFVLLGRDKHAPQLVEMWAGMRAAEGEDPAKVEEALKCAKAMRRYRYERKGAPPCEYCDASGGESGCLGTSTEVVCEDGFLWWYSCNGPDTFLATNRNDETVHRTIEEYFATDEVDNEYCKNEALRVYHETRAMRARANEAAMGKDERKPIPRDWSKSILEEVDRLHASAKGSGDPMTLEATIACVEWLREQVEDAWENPNNGDAYDDAVRNLARAAIAEGRKDIEEMKARANEAVMGEGPEELPDYGGGISGG